MVLKASSIVDMMNEDVRKFEKLIDDSIMKRKELLFGEGLFVVYPFGITEQQKQKVIEVYTENGFSIDDFTKVGIDYRGDRYAQKGWLIKIKK